MVKIDLMFPNRKFINLYVNDIVPNSYQTFGKRQRYILKKKKNMQSIKKKKNSKQEGKKKIRVKGFSNTTFTGTITFIFSVDPII